jgi:hypothetical protein
MMSFVLVTFSFLNLSGASVVRDAKFGETKEAAWVEQSAHLVATHFGDLHALIDANVETVAENGELHDKLEKLKNDLHDVRMQIAAHGGKREGCAQGSCNNGQECCANSSPNGAAYCSSSKCSSCGEGCTNR